MPARLWLLFSRHSPLATSLAPRPGCGSTGPWSATASISRAGLPRSAARSDTSSATTTPTARTCSRRTAARLTSKEVRLSDVDRFVIKLLWAEWQDHLAQRLAVSKKLKAFVAKAPQREAEAREILKTAPEVSPVTAEVILSELGDISRFRNAKTVCAYAELVPVVRQSGERKSKDMKITKEGSGLLRWALVETAWRLVGKSPKWAALFSRLRHRSGKKRAI